MDLISLTHSTFIIVLFPDIGGMALPNCCPEGHRLDAGHVCQNLYLACAAIMGGTCAIAAYHQELMDGLVHVDGNDEFVIYLAAVGKV